MENCHSLIHSSQATASPQCVVGIQSLALSGFAPAGSWHQEVELGIKPGHTDRDLASQRHPNRYANCQPWDSVFFI